MDEKIKELIQAMNSILIGKEEKIKILVANLLVGGNILLEDMPGVGKTIISKSFARLISKEEGESVKFSRIQGTPDLLPYDITGVDVYEPNSERFVFKEGPIFTDILLADELNRTTPKVQSALLEAMAEKQVTVGNKSYILPEMFFVIATQNPVETEGTYPLPPAQLDRFTCCLTIGYPDFEHEMEIFKKGKSEERLVQLESVISIEDILALRAKIKEIEVNNKILEVIASICNRTRKSKEIRLGLSTRAGLMMIDILKSFAFLSDRNYVIDQDLIYLAQAVWAHRLIITNPQVSSSTFIDEVTREEVQKMVGKA